MNTDLLFYSSQIKGLEITESYGNYCLHIEPGSLCTFNIDYPSNRPHFHNCYEICLVTSGYGQFIHGNDLYKIRKGDVFIANPQIPHEISILHDSDNSENKLELIYFILNIYSNLRTTPKLYEEKLLYDFLNKHCIIRSANEHLYEYVNFIVNYSKNGHNQTYGIYQSIKNLVIECITALTIEQNKYFCDSHSKTVIDIALEYIRTNTRHKIFVKDIAAHCHISVRNLQYLFKKHLNKTVIEIVNLEKMNLASNYLKMNFNAFEAASYVGINNPESFSRLFKKYYGVSPKKYKQIHSLTGMNYSSLSI